MLVPNNNAKLRAYCTLSPFSSSHLPDLFQSSKLPILAWVPLALPPFILLLITGTNKKEIQLLESPLKLHLEHWQYFHATKR